MKKLWFPLIGLFLFYAASLYARDIVLTVEDSDLGIPLEGALIVLGEGEEYYCDPEGKALIPVPEDRPVTLRISYPGYESGRLLIPLSGTTFTAGLRLGGIMENQELVIEVQGAGTSETRSGRSVAVSGRTLSRTAEIGIVEDVMTAVKLLPGVGYVGGYRAMPSIRGGEPSDLIAAFDGFYIERPYHLGGTFSIFDPKMVSGARLSHGIFSTRYGHTISGLLDISSKEPSNTELELELGVSTSATNLNLSYPLWGKGGIMVMGRVSYWDPFVWLAKQFVEIVRSVKTAPYIRSGALSADYQFSADFGVKLNGFFGGDGMAVSYSNETGAVTDSEWSRSEAEFYWDNKIGFITAGFIYNPLANLLLKTNLGAGLLRMDVEGYTFNEVHRSYTRNFIDIWDERLDGIDDGLIRGESGYSYSDGGRDIFFSDRTLSYQGRVDLDWEIGGGFLFAAGIEEIYKQWRRSQRFSSLYEHEEDLAIYGDLISGGQIYSIDNGFALIRSGALNSAAYTLLEYSSPNRRFGAEAGLRGDHLYFMGEDFSIQSMPVLNPRLTTEFGLLRDRGPVDDLTLTLGSGLFSSMNNAIQNLNSQSGVHDFDMKQNRSWTSLVGTRIDFVRGFSFTIEGYFKHVYDRAYTYREIDVEEGVSTQVYRFDGKGRIWGFDLMLQKFDARYWDGWISYTFTHARYRDSPEDGWYYPSFQRFHYLNLVLNIKPVKTFHITTRFGFASGRPKNEVGAVSSYPLLYPDPAGGTEDVIVEKWRREEWYSDTARTSFAIPWDIKFSIFRFNPQGKVQSEIYFNIENILSLVYTPGGNRSFNSATGEEEEGSSTASYDLPIPMISFGFKWTY
ncbi:MAG: hypothetical protein LBP93_09500 [Treponema sp.]|jgi:hypothetical protein|nr:hypothetical protein [Treponema sp.]